MSEHSTRIAVLLSGSGRTLQNLHDRIEDGSLNASLVCAISDRDGVVGLERARRMELPTYVSVDQAETWELLRQHKPDLVCLCGYLRLLPIPAGYSSRVLNIHPALLPAFGGKGFHGHHVHEAVLASGDSESGCTVHYCNDEYDRGEILLQKRVPVLPEDDTDSLAARVFQAECEAYPEAIRLWQQQHR